jgi:hypothetical protein
LRLKKRIEKIESGLRTERQTHDHWFDYVLTADSFRSRAQNSVAIFRPAPDIDRLRHEYGHERAHQIWLDHYSYYKDGKLLDPPDDFKADIDMLGSFTLQDWYEIILDHALQYPHKIVFQLAEFGLQRYLPRVESLPHIVYEPQCAMEGPHQQV